MPVKNLLLTPLFIVVTFISQAQTLTKNINNRLLQKKMLLKKGLICHPQILTSPTFFKTPITQWCMDLLEIITSD